MNFWEAYQEMKKGRKVTRSKSGTAIFYIQEKRIHYHYPGDRPEMIDVTEDHLEDTWELKQEPRKVTLYQYLLRRSDGIFFLTDWSSQDKNDRCNNLSFEILKTFTREIEF